MPRGVFDKVIKDMGSKNGLDYSHKKFLRDLGAEAGYVNPEAVEKVYLALIRLVAKQMVTFGVSRLPHICDMWIGYSGTAYDKGEYKPRYSVVVCKALTKHVRSILTSGRVKQVGHRYDPVADPTERNRLNDFFKNR
jgi:hypothetical protein